MKHHIIGWGGAMKPKHYIRTRVIKNEPLDVFKVVGFIAGVIGICVAIGMWAGLLGLSQ